WMNALIGLGLAVPEAAAPVIVAATVYAAHHGLAKGALFLGVGVAEGAPRRGWGRILVGAGLLLPALAIAGAPLTSGSIAKAEVKALVYLAPEGWRWGINLFLPIAAGATTLLLAHWFIMIHRSYGDEKAPRNLSAWIWAPWMAVVIVGLFGFG